LYHHALKTSDQKFCTIKATKEIRPSRDSLIQLHVHGFFLVGRFFLSSGPSSLDAADGAGDLVNVALGSWTVAI
jgi:hypothetical protein